MQISIEPQDLGAVMAALRIRIVYLQSFKKDLDLKGEKAASESVMRDIASLTFVIDSIEEAKIGRWDQ
jgi:hypothetical protein